MMISPDAFYEMELKGKSIEQIQKVIRSLKRETNRLKRVLESGVEHDLVCPSEATRISCNRDYLLRARLALMEAGGVYEPTRAEQRADEFQERIPEISKVIFVRSAFPNPRSIFEIDIEGEKATFHYGWSFQEMEEGEINKAEFLSELEALHLGEWKSRYVDMMILDGEQWELTVEYGNPKDTFVVYGSNEYPYNFEELAELMDRRAEIMG